MVQHSIAVSFLSMLFQSSLSKYVHISLYLPLWTFLLYVFIFLLFVFSVYFLCQNMFDSDHCYPVVHVF